MLTAAALAVTVTACGSDEAAGDVRVDPTEVENVIDTAVDRADTATTDLAQALRDNGLQNVAGLVEQIDVEEWIGDKDFTFFAPNDEAFTTLTADETADLLTDPTQILEVLRNHTLAGAVTAAELASATAVDTEAGETIAVTTDADTVQIGDVTVVTTDIEVGGGVIHVVDGFLLP